MGKAFITDYITNPDVEIKILSDLYTDKISDEVEVLMVWHHEINSKYLKNFPNLKGIVRYGVGIDKINFNDAKERKLVICNTPDYATDEVSDSALSMIMNIVRGTQVYDKECRNNPDIWKKNTILKNLKRASRQTLGVIGAGRIGSALIKKALAIGFNVVFYDPYKEAGYEKIIKADRTNELSILISQSDIISIHTPLTEETKNLVNKEFIKKMKYGSSLINTARGTIIEDLDVLYDALKSKKINCIGLDVLPDEPPKECKLIRAWEKNESISSRIIINPHISYYSIHSYEESRTKTALNAKKIIMGETPTNIIKDYRI